MEIIAYIRNAFPTKFGLPRQSGLVKDLKGYIVFEKEYAVPEARGAFKSASILLNFFRSKFFITLL